jgi:parallel beta-helix repeat protein
MRSLLLIISWLTAILSLPAQQLVHVDVVHGNDDMQGTAIHPLKSLEAALKMATRYDSSQILLHEGTYFIGQTVTVSDAKNMVVRNFDDDHVLLTGGVKVEGFEKITSHDKLYGRFSRDAVDHIYKLDLARYNITDFGSFKQRGFGKDMASSPMELYYNHEPMTIARWPDSGWIEIKNVPKRLKGKGFVYEDDRPATWRHPEEVWMHGYWKWDWADSYVKIASINKKKKEILTTTGTGNYDFSKGGRYYYLNVAEELDHPGEYYVDRQNGVLYFYPPDDDLSKEMYVSVTEDPLLMIDHSENVVIEGLEISYSRGAGIIIRGGKGNEVRDCEISNLGIVAVSIGRFEPNPGSVIYKNTLYNGDAGLDNGVTGCKIYHTGEGGVLLGGGDRKTLESGNNFVENCEIHSCSDWVRTYRAAVYMYGVGNKVRHNKIYDLPHTAVFFWGNEHFVEYNNIHNVCMETADAGAVYAGRDWTQRGNMIRYNYIHDLHGTESKHSYNAVMGVYLDDFCSGDTIFGNIFYRAGRNILIGGGRDHVVQNNIFIQGQPGVHVDARGIGWAKYYFTSREMILYTRYDAVTKGNSPYLEKYPPLKTVESDQPELPKYNCILNNVFCGGKWRELLDGLDDSIVCFRNNKVFKSCDFYQIKGDKILIDFDKMDAPDGFRKIDVQKIGIVK